MDAAASVLAYDRAAGRKEQEALNNVGIVLATRAIMDNAPDDTSHYPQTQTNRAHHRTLRGDALFRGNPKTPASGN